MGWKRRRGEIADEIREHLEEKIEELVAEGLTREDAEHAARREFGNVTKVKEDGRSAWGWVWLENFLMDVRYALRQLRANPGFTTVAILTLALGIGANTAIFSLLNNAMLQRVPVKHPEELYVARWSANGAPKTAGSSSYGDCGRSQWSKERSEACSVPRPLFGEIRAHNEVFAGVAAFAGPAQVTLSGNGLASMARAELVSGDYFSTLGVNAMIGRTFESSDEAAAAAPVAVLSYGYWKAAFGGRPDALGRVINLNGVAFTVVGVADPGFTRLTPGHSQDLWVPISQFHALRLRWGGGEDENNNWWVTVVARMKPGGNHAQAEAQVSGLFQNWVTANGQLKASEEPKVALLPIQKGLVGNRNQIATPIYITMAAVGIVLLIACANVAGLMVSRGAARQKEIAVRLALGAGRGRVMQQLLTESVMLSLAGAGLGCLFAVWGGQALVSFLSAGQRNPTLLEAKLDGTVLAFTVAIAVLTGVLFGLAPGLRGTRVDVTPALKSNTVNLGVERRSGRGRFGLGSLLVAAQVGLSVVLLVGAGLVVRTLMNLQKIDPGFDTNNLVIFGIDPGLTGYYKGEQITRLYSEVERRISALPGVISTSYSSDALLDGSLWTSDVKIQGRKDATAVETSMLAVGPEFLKTMKIPLLAGRTLSVEDIEGKKIVAVVNRTFVERFLEGHEPIGLHFGGDDPKAPQYEIVGVVGDAKYDDLRSPVAPTAYVPIKEGSAYFAVRTAGDPAAAVPTLRKTIAELDNNLPLYDVRTQTERIDRLLMTERLMARLASLFGLLALALACIGLFGLLSYEVARRTREIGIRTALGAQKQDVVRLVVRQGLALVIVGALAGTAAAFGLTRYLESLLYGVGAGDPLTFVAVCTLLIVVAMVAAWLPARRAAKVDPMVALRYE